MTIALVALPAATSDGSGLWVVGAVLVLAGTLTAAAARGLVRRRSTSTV